MKFTDLEDAAHNDKFLKLTSDEVKLLWKSFIEEQEHAYWRGVEAGEKGRKSMQGRTHANR